MQMTICCLRWWKLWLVQNFGQKIFPVRIIRNFWYIVATFMRNRNKGQTVLSLIKREPGWRLSCSSSLIPCLPVAFATYLHFTLCWLLHSFSAFSFTEGRRCIFFRIINQFENNWRRIDIFTKVMIFKGYLLSVFQIALIRSFFLFFLHLARVVPGCFIFSSLA